MGRVGVQVSRDPHLCLECTAHGELESHDCTTRQLTSVFALPARLGDAQVAEVQHLGPAARKGRHFDGQRGRCHIVYHVHRAHKTLELKLGSAARAPRPTQRQDARRCHAPRTEVRAHVTLDRWPEVARTTPGEPGEAGRRARRRHGGRLSYSSLCICRHDLPQWSKSLVLGRRSIGHPGVRDGSLRQVVAFGCLPGRTTAHHASKHGWHVCARKTAVLAKFRQTDSKRTTRIVFSPGSREEKDLAGSVYCRNKEALQLTHSQSAPVHCAITPGQDRE